MVNVNELNAESAELYNIAGLYDIERCGVQKSVFAELALNKTYCQLRTVNRDIDSF